jgi:polar amino acid transport system substrate-binding protein
LNTPYGRFALLALVMLTSATASVAQDTKRTNFRWGTDPTGGAPFIYQNDAGQFVGFEVDFAEYLAKRLGQKSEFVKGSWDKLPQLLDQPVSDAAGIDVVMNGYELREDLAKDYAPSRPYYVYRLQLLAHRDDDTIDGWGDLVAKAGRGGKSVGVLGGTVSHDYLKQRFGTKIDLQINEDVATVIGLVKDKRLASTVQDSPAATYFARETPQLKLVGEPVKPGFYVLYARKTPEGRALLDQIDAAIRDGVKDGTLKTIYQKYGLWNEDQERLSYWQDKPWPPFGDAAEKKDEVNAETHTRSRWDTYGRLLSELLDAAKMTVFLSIVSFPIAMAGGLMLAIGRFYGPAWVRIPFAIYVELFRGTPLLLQLYAIFYLLPPLITWLTAHGVWVPIESLSPLQAGILGLALNYAAYEAENYRAGLQSVPKGQIEAGLALGMSRLAVIRRVVVPQAVRTVIPPVTNDFIALFKDTACCSVILITELTRKYNELYNFNRDYIVELVFLTAGLYLLMSYPLSLAAQWMERRFATNAPNRK